MNLNNKNDMTIQDYKTCEGLVQARVAELTREIEEKVAKVAYPSEDLISVIREVAGEVNKSLMAGAGVAGVAGVVAAVVAADAPERNDQWWLTLAVALGLAAAGLGYAAVKSAQPKTVTTMEKPEVDFGALGLSLRQYLGDINRSVSEQWRAFQDETEKELAEYIGAQPWEQRRQIELKQSLYQRALIDFDMQSCFVGLSKAFETKQVENYRKFVSDFKTGYIAALKKSAEELKELYKAVFAE